MKLSLQARCIWFGYLSRCGLFAKCSRSCQRNDALSRRQLAQESPRSEVLTKAQPTITSPFCTWDESPQKLLGENHIRGPTLDQLLEKYAEHIVVDYAPPLENHFGEVSYECNSRVMGWRRTSILAARSVDDSRDGGDRHSRWCDGRRQKRCHVRSDFRRRHPVPHAHAELVEHSFCSHKEAQKGQERSSCTFCAFLWLFLFFTKG